MTTYLEETPFQPKGQGNGYSVEIDDEGILIYSECCADRMSDDTARAVHEALGRYLAQHHAASPTPGG